jgi:hypothetical protein
MFLVKLKVKTDTGSIEYEEYEVQEVTEEKANVKAMDEYEDEYGRTYEELTIISSEEIQ